MLVTRSSARDLGHDRLGASLGHPGDGQQPGGVALLVTRVDRGQVDLGHDGRVERVLGQNQRPRDAVELAPHRSVKRLCPGSPEPPSTARSMLASAAACCMSLGEIPSSFRSCSPRSWRRSKNRPTSRPRTWSGSFRSVSVTRFSGGLSRPAIRPRPWRTLSQYSVRRRCRRRRSSEGSTSSRPSPQRMAWSAPTYSCPDLICGSPTPSCAKWSGPTFLRRDEHWPMDGLPASSPSGDRPSNGSPRTSGRRWRWGIRGSSRRCSLPPPGSGSRGRRRQRSRCSPVPLPSRRRPTCASASPWRSPKRRPRPAILTLSLPRARLARWLEDRPRRQRRRSTWLGRSLSGGTSGRPSTCSTSRRPPLTPSIRSWRCRWRRSCWAPELLDHLGEIHVPDLPRRVPVRARSSAASPRPAARACKSDPLPGASSQPGPEKGFTHNLSFSSYDRPSIDDPGLRRAGWWRMVPNGISSYACAGGLGPRPLLI